jgi:hypothetical protein
MAGLLWLIEVGISGVFMGGVLISYIEDSIFFEISPDAYISYVNWERSIDGVLSKFMLPLGMLWVAALIGLLDSVKPAACVLLVGALICGTGFIAVMAKMNQLFSPKIEYWQGLCRIRIGFASTAFLLSLLALLSMF